MTDQLFKIRKNQAIFKLFINIIRELNKIGIEPVVYGSLGLYLQIGEREQINDIDFVLKDADFSKRWKKINVVMNDFGYKIDPAHNQEFIGKKPYVSFLTIEQIKELTSGIKKLPSVELNGANFFNFQLEDYLKIYQEGSKNKWRKKKKEKDDLHKIDLIRKELAIN